MNVAGIVSNDVVTKSRIADALKIHGIETVYIHSAANFDKQGFATIFVDLESPHALLVLKVAPSKCIAFGAANDEAKIKQAKLLGCDRVYKHGEFFKKVLPGFVH